MRERLLEGLTARLGPDGVLVNGNPARGLPHILNVSYPGISADTMLMNLDLAGVAASSGSACTSGSLQPSHVLAAMGLPPERIRSAVRFSFGLGNTIEEADEAVKIIATIAARLRNK
jgi:cysteine desulfurase